MSKVGMLERCTDDGCSSRFEKTLKRRDRRDWLAVVYLEVGQIIYS